MKILRKLLKRIFNNIKNFSMTNFMERQKGAISIFLVGCMLPMLAITGILIDASRFTLASGIIASAEDLALNTVLAEYHGELQDWYGLMGAQGKTEDAEKSLKSSVTYTPAGGSSWGTGAMSGGGGSLIPISVNEVSVEPLKNANLGNPAVLHGQIVEFMKYRAPVNLVTTIFETISIASGDAAESAANSRLVQEQNDTYEAMQELIDKLDELLEKINEYEDLELTEDYINNIIVKYSDQETVDGVKTFKAQYDDLHNTRVHEWQEMEDYVDVAENRTWRFKNFNTFSYTFDFDSVWAALLGLITSFELQSKQYAEMERELYKYGDLKPWTDTEDQSRWSAQVYEAIVDSDEYANYRIRVQTTELIYEGLIAMLDERIAEGETETETEEEIDLGLAYFHEYKLSSDKTSIVEDHSRAVPILSISPEDLKSQLEDDFKDGINKKYSGRSSDIDKMYDRTYEHFERKDNFQMSALEEQVVYHIAVDELKALHDNSKEANDILNDMIPISNDLIGLVEDYQKEREEWEAEVAKGQGSSEMLEAHNEELYGLDTNDLINTALELTVQDATDFSDHVDKLSQMYKDNEKIIHDFKYGSKKILYVYNRQQFMNGVVDSDISIPDMQTKDYRNNKKLDEIADTSFAEVWKHPENWAEIVFDEANNTHPDLNVPSNRLYEFAKEYEEKYKANDEDSSGKGAWEAFKKLTDDISFDITPNELVTGSVIAGSVEDIPANLVERIFGDSSEATSEVAKLGDIGTISAIRDNLFILDYMFSMFSYDTLRTETYVAFHNYDNVSDSKGDWEKNKPNWTTEDDTYNYVNRNLRNQFLKPANEFSGGQDTFGSETEYIVYGNGSFGSQLTAYFNILLIRVAFNILPVFRWIRSLGDGLPFAVNVMANAVGMFVPVGRAVVFAFAIFLATLLETLMDMNAIKWGLSAPLVKKPERSGEYLSIVEKWDAFIGGADKNGILTDKGSKPKSDTVNDVSPPKTDDSRNTSDSSYTNKGESGKNFNPNDWYYSTYLMLFGFLGLTFSHETVVSRIGDQIAHNVGIDNMSELDTAYSLTGTAKLDSMFDLTGILGESLSPWNYEFSLEKGY